MSLNFRRFLFVLFVIIFAVAGTIIIYYTKGYRVDFSNFSIVKTGGVYIESNVAGFQIDLGKNVYNDQSGLFKKSTLISGILPKKYILTIKKDGYNDYEKNIEVLPSQVFRLFNVLLVPKTITPYFSATNILGDSIVDTSGRKIITFDKEKNIYYLYDFSSMSATSSSPINITSKISPIIKQKIVSVWFNPQKDNTFIVQTAKGLYQIDLTAKIASPIQIGKIDSVSIQNNNLYALLENPIPKKSLNTTSSPPSKIITYDLSLNSKVLEFNLPYGASSIVKFAPINNVVILLLSDGALYAYDFSGNQLYQIAHSAKMFSVSDDKNKIFFQDKDGKSFVYTFDDEKQFLDASQNISIGLKLIDTLNIDQVWWYPDSFHLILEYPNKITVAEVTQKNPNENFTLVNSFDEAFYSSTNKILYTIKSGTLNFWDISKI